MTTVATVQLVAPVLLGNSDVSVYTAPAATTARISRAVFCNSSAAAVTITAGLTTGGAIAAATTLISARPIAIGESYTAPELAGLVIPAGSSLRAFASVASDVSFEASGVTIV